MPRDERKIIERLRRSFFEAGEDDCGPLPDYWLDPATLDAYDGFLALRIGWKWDAVLDELQAKGLLPPACTVLDWGCGTGVAARRLLARIPVERILLYDRSALAMEFAAARLREEAPGGVAIERAAAVGASPVDLLLVSHVLDELDEGALESLMEQARSSRRVLWVEPGARRASRRLSEVRDRLLPAFAVFAPCPHQEPCPALASGPRDWCHFFARPPSEAFRDGDLAKQARAIGVDLRSLPYHFLHLVRRDALETFGCVPPSGGSRILGRPDVRPKDASVVQCESGGLRTARIAKSADPSLWRALKKHPESLRDLSL